MRHSSHPKAVAHPKLQEVEFQFNDGRSLKILSAMNEKIFHAGDWPLDNHAAWTKTTNMNLKSATRFAKFKDKFGELGGLFDESDKPSNESSSEEA